MYICNMENKYNIGDVIEDRYSKKFGVIKDFEVFDDMVLYYLNEGGALPENRVYLKGVKSIVSFLNKTNQEKNQVWEKLFKKHGGK